MKALIWGVIWAVAICTATAENIPCLPRDFDHGSVVCVCNATYCDTFGPIRAPNDGEFYHVVSSKAGERFNASAGTLVGEISVDPDVLVTVNRSIQYQKIIGFGGAFTDAAAINIAAMSEPLQKSILESYYGENGLEYNVGRVNIGGCDFSTRLYTYDDVEGDELLEHFALAEEDTEFKIPYVLKALELNPNIKMFASPWTAPKWMKTNNDYIGYGFLKEEYYQAWANYFVRFLDEYAKRNVSFWAVTAQNEPVDGTIPGFQFNCMGWTPAQQRDFIKNNLGPTIASSPYNDTKIIMFDDQRPFINIWTRTVLGDSEANKHIAGIGVHWYWDAFPGSLLNTAHEEFPDKFIFGTEACAGSLPLEDPVILGSWERGQLYAQDIINDLNHWVGGWTDWNLVLDIEGGPNWEGNTVDAPIIVDNSTDEAYKQPMFYALGHFSKFLPEGSVRVSATSDDRKGLYVTAFQRPDEAITVIILNLGEDTQTLAVDDTEKGVVAVTIGPKSLHSIVY